MDRSAGILMVPDFQVASANSFQRGHRYFVMVRLAPDEFWMKHRVDPKG